MRDVYDSSGRKIGRLNDGYSLGCGIVVVCIVIFFAIAGINPFESAEERRRKEAEYRQEKVEGKVQLSISDFSKQEDKNGKELITFEVTYQNLKEKPHTQTKKFLWATSLGQNKLIELGERGVDVVKFARTADIDYVTEEHHRYEANVSTQPEQYIWIRTESENKELLLAGYVLGIEMKGDSFVVP